MAAEDYGASVWEWMHVVRRARLGRTVTGCAAVLASYGNPDGTRVFPGVARFAVEAEVEYKTAQAVLAKLREVGLIERVKRAGRRDEHDEYRLILHADLLDRVEVLGPDEVKLAAVKVRRPRGNKERVNGRQPAPRGDVGVESGSEAVQNQPGPVDEALEAVGIQPGAVDDRVRKRTRPVGTSAHGAPLSTATSDRPAPDVSPNGGAVPIDRSTTVPGISPSQLVVDLEAQPTTARASPPPVCPHGNNPRRRRGGAPRCPDCRRESMAPSAPPEPHEGDRG